MQTEKLPEFEGKLLVPKELEDTFPKYNFLRGNYGKAVLEQYNARVKEDFSDNKFLQVFLYDDDLIKGSNTPGNILINQIISKNNPKIHIATQADLEDILRVNLFDLTETYEDTGLVLRSEGNPNGYFTKNLSKQLEDKSKLQYPVLIHLKDLTLRKDDESPLGVSFNIREDAELIYDEILSHSGGNFSSEHIDPKTGLPSKLGEGNRFFGTKNSGLSGLCLNYDMNLSACYDDLADSNVDGRVVVVSAEGINFCNDYINQLKEQTDKLKLEFDKRFEFCSKYLMTGEK